MYLECKSRCGVNIDEVSFKSFQIQMGPQTATRWKPPLANIGTIVQMEKKGKGKQTKTCLKSNLARTTAISTRPSAL